MCTCVQSQLVYMHVCVASNGLLPLEGHTSRANHPFVIAGGRVIQPREQQRQDGDKDGENERGNPASSPAPGEISNSKVN